MTRRKRAEPRQIQAGVVNKELDKDRVEMATIKSQSITREEYYRRLEDDPKHQVRRQPYIRKSD